MEYKKLIIKCKGCNYTWYPDKKKWESNPDAPEPDCPNPECKHYGTGLHISSPEDSIWVNLGILTNDFQNPITYSDTD